MRDRKRILPADFARAGSERRLLLVLDEVDVDGELRKGVEFGATRVPEDVPVYLRLLWGVWLVLGSV